LGVIGPVAELINSVAELVVDLVPVAEPQNIDRVDVRVSPILLPVQRVTPQGRGVEEQRMIPVVLHQIQRLPDVEKRRRGIPQFLKHQLKLVGCLIPRIDLDLALGLVKSGTGDHQEGGMQQDVFCTLVVCKSHFGSSHHLNGPASLYVRCVNLIYGALVGLRSIILAAYHYVKYLALCGPPENAEVKLHPWPKSDNDARTGTLQGCVLDDDLGFVDVLEDREFVELNSIYDILEAEIYLGDCVCLH
jgi:hypothetical protein